MEMSKDPNIYDKIIKSTAPSIQGYRAVKEAIALQLFGGSAKDLEDKTRIRGDIHILIVGSRYWKIPDAEVRVQAGTPWYLHQW